MGQGEGMNRREFWGVTAGALIVAPVMGLMPTRFPDEIILLIDEDGLVTEMWTPPHTDYFLKEFEIGSAFWDQQIKILAKAHWIPRRFLNG